MDREDIKMLVKKWWDIYNDESLDFKGENPVSEEETFSKSSIMASMPEPTISYIPAPTAAWVLTNKKKELLEVSVIPSFLSVFFYFFFFLVFPILYFFEATWPFFVVRVHRKYIYEAA